MGEMTGKKEERKTQYCPPTKRKVTMAPGKMGWVAGKNAGNQRGPPQLSEGKERRGGAPNGRASNNTKKEKVQK